MLQRRVCLTPFGVAIHITPKQIWTMEIAMARSGAAAEQEKTVSYRGLRGWLEQVDKLGELERVSGASWDVEMGGLTQMLTENSRGTAPALLFDDVPGYPKGYRTLYGQLSSIRRIALTLGLPLEYQRKVDIVQRYHARMSELKPLKPRFVNDGPVFENVVEGDKIDVLKFPVPRHHEADTSRFIGTACAVVTKDPDDGWFNLGAYRSQVYDGKTVGCQITEGKHGRIHRDKYFARGEPMKVVILCGQDPLLFMLSSSPLPEVSEYDIAGRSPDFRSRPTAKSPSRARRCRVTSSRKVRSANGWATIPTTRRTGRS
jgi:UbiD family decarboxylase